MQCRNYGKPTGPKHYVHDVWKPWTLKPQIKPQGNGHNGPWSCVDQSPSKYWYRRPRSVNQNASKILCFEGQCQPHQGRQRLVLKNRLYSARKDQKIEPVQSKKSIPNHALMKNLLSGLSIFEDDKKLTKLQTTESSVYRHKSMGNLNGFCQRGHGVKPSARSSVDFTEMSLVNRDFNDEDFREYCRNYAKGSIAKIHHETVQYTPEMYVPENYFAPKSCTDKMCPYNCQKNIGDGCFFKHYSKVLDEDVSRFRNMPFCVQRRNIVQERKQFFEKKEKDIKEECRMSKHKPPAIFILPPEKENNSSADHESITELYRNDKTIASTTTISRSKHSRAKFVQPKHVELFHPEYNFDDKSSSSDLRQSIIDSIRAKIFHSPSSFPEEDEDFAPRFPKETRKAVSIIMNQKRLCKCRTKQVLNVETQTSPVSSKHTFVAPNGLPCTKNLLCRKGHHSGRCEEEISRRLESICRGDCLCKRNQYSSDALRSSLWSLRNRSHSSPQENLVSEQPYDEESYDNYNYVNYVPYEYDAALPLQAAVNVRDDSEKYRERASYGKLFSVGLSVTRRHTFSASARKQQNFLLC